ncbi:O-antigen ligase family protein [Azospirillum doebereinerae]|uniref:O-antigen ligase family protein n=1 Tax=Azospirillum doebereinerae TaxID=92933 RepID=A0A433JCN9_9PROT|nr:O-antigen ligase family protein [Azospirillum doebereinerae]RUQ74449.1 O-antigen ligase family protein [Azospirillum doebereinerae]
MKILEFLEKFIAVVCIMAFGGTVLPVLLTGGSVVAADQESSGAMMFFAGIYVLILALIAMRPSLAFRIPLASPAVTFLLVFAFVSSLWSLFPDVTLRRSLAFLFTTVFGIYLALRFTFPEIMRLLVTGLSALMFLSFASVVAMPAVGLDSAQHVGAWKGIFFQKNVTGRMMVWLVLCLLWLDWQREAKRWVTRSLLALALLLIVMSRSGTGLVTSVLVAAALLATGLVRGNIRSFAPTMAIMLVVLILAGTAIASFWYDALYALGRDPTLTGRTVLWDHILGSISERSLLGYGYAAYWYGAYGPGSAFIESWGINSAHNGWLEATLDLGIPGVLVLLGILGRLIFQGFFASRYGASRAEPAWAFAVGCALVAISISESVFLERHSMNWIVLVIGVVRLMELGRRSRYQQALAQSNARHQQQAYANAPAYAGPGRQF